MTPENLPEMPSLTASVRYLGQKRRQLCLTVALCVADCSSPVSHAPIIAKYQEAECIPFSAQPHIFPHTREWDTALTLADGLRFNVSGADTVSGRITVYFPASGKKIIAADPTDYIYPTDVRMDRHAGRLYVKANGLAVLSGEETWLFEFDVRSQRILARTQVRNGILSVECPEPPKSK